MEGWLAKTASRYSSPRALLLSVEPARVDGGVEAPGVEGQREVVADPGNVIAGGGFFEDGIGAAAVGALHVFELDDGDARAGGRMEGGGIVDLGSVAARRTGRGPAASGQQTTPRRWPENRDGALRTEVWAGQTKRCMAVGRLPMGHCNGREGGRLGSLAVMPGGPLSPCRHPLPPFVVGEDGAQRREGFARTPRDIWSRVVTDETSSGRRRGR